MTERSIPLETGVALAHGRTLEKKPLPESVDELRDVTREVAGHFFRIFEGGSGMDEAKTKLGKWFEKEGKIGGREFKNWGDLDTALREETFVKGLSEEELYRASDLRGVVMDGAVIAAMTWEEKKPDLAAAMRDKTNGGNKIDGMIGMPGWGGVGEMVRRSTITDPAVLEVMKKMKIMMLGGSSLEDVVEKSQGRLMDMSSEDADALLAYGSAVLAAAKEARKEEGVSGGAQPVVDAITNLMSDDGLRVPEDDNPGVELELQLEFIRGVLRKAELISGPISDMDYQREVARIEKHMDEFRPEVKEEIKARLCIDFCWRLMNQANGFISTKEGITMGQAANYAVEQQKDPTRDVMNFLFSRDRDVNGLPFREAWDFVEFANFRYLDLLDMMTKKGELEKLRDKFGSRVTDERLKGGLKASFDNDRQLFLAEVNFETDSDLERKTWIRHFMMTKIAEGWVYDGKREKLVKGKKGKFDIDLVKQGLSMAERAAVAFGESNVANAGLQQGNDELAELIDIVRYRKGKRQRTKAGPAYHREKINTIPGATSWVRQLDASHPDNRQPMWATDVAWQKVAQGDYRFYYGVTLGKIYRFTHDFLLNTALKPQDILDINVIKDLAHWADNAERPNMVVQVPEGKESRYLKVNERMVDVRRGKKVRKERERYVNYEGDEYVVTEPKRSVDILKSRVEGGYVFVGKEGEAKSYRIERESRIEVNSKTGEEEKREVEFVRYGRRKYEIKEVEAASVELPRVGKIEVKMGRNGDQLLRIRFLQGLLECWTKNEALGATMDSIATLRMLMTEQPMGAGYDTFESPENWINSIANNKKLNVAKEMAKMEVSRRIAGRNRRATGPLRQ